MKNHICECGSKDYITKFRSIQVKSSRIEKKGTYGIDHKPRDLIKSSEHFFIWCLIDNEDKSNFLVMSVNDYINTMGNSIKGASFFKDQDRQHFNIKDFGKWKKYKNDFKRLE